MNPFKSLIIPSLLFALSIFYTFNLVATLDLLKAQTLVAHVQQSIENAEKETSQLTPEILNIDGMSSSKIRHFLNNICSLKDINYLEIGCWKGSTLISAAYNNEENFNHLIAIDNWSLCGSVKNDFIQNVKSYLKATPLRFYEIDCFAIDKASVFQQPINIYFYDGEHTFEDQKKAFTFFDSILDDVFIAMVDDWNWDRVRYGTFTAFEELGYQILFQKSFFTKGNGDRESWWNGFYVAVISKNRA